MDQSRANKIGIVDDEASAVFAAAGQAGAHASAQPVAMPATAAEGEALRIAFARLRAAQERAPWVTYSERMAALSKLLGLTQKRRGDIITAIGNDFGQRSAQVTELGDLFPVVQSIKYVQSQLKSWMKPEPRSVSLMFKPGRARVQYQARGVVGVVSPWNYPYHLAIVPVVYALAAGNRVLLKPSELVPETSRLLAEIVNGAFADDYFYVVTGDARVGAEFTSLAFDHLLFTGSVSTGREVSKAAANNLTSVTLELGGKNPIVVHESYPALKAARRIIAGKLLNSGQTCVAGDYLFVPERQLESMIGALTSAATEQYPSLRNNQDYASIVNQAHYQRLQGLLQEATARGTRIIEINPSSEDLLAAQRKIAPTLVVDPPDDLKLMQDEIFGPILPIKPYRQLEDVIRFINARPRPLALYYFDADAERARRVLESTISGGVGINTTVLQLAQEDLPFGGIGASGMGAYHGKEGFEAFSHKRAVYEQGGLSFVPLLYPPFSGRTRRIIDWLLR